MGQTSLAATHDRQEAYEGGADGYSMTKVLVEILGTFCSTVVKSARLLTAVASVDNDPHPTYHDLAYKLG